MFTILPTRDILGRSHGIVQGAEAQAKIHTLGQGGKVYEGIAVALLVLDDFVAMAFVIGDGERSVPLE